ncbi:hypothetical protein AABC73_14465 [Pseudomonas sp. G.S.17]|uniref:hypothetical protein n=1 Tax=Pseudomonas sp. G.S.17 TaxID=3137451 RepID=UPI00311CC35E
MTSVFPPRRIIDDLQTIIVLDTNSARGLAHEEGCPEWVDTFSKMSREGYSFALSDVAYAELVNQRRENGISAAQFHRMCSRLAKFLNPSFPVIPGGGDVSGMIQQSRERWSVQECQTISTGAWSELLRCTNSEFAPESTEWVLEQARAEWRAMLWGWQEGVNALRDNYRTKMRLLQALDDSGILPGFKGISIENWLKTLEAMHILQAHAIEDFETAFNNIPKALVQNLLQALKPLAKEDLPGVLGFIWGYTEQKDRPASVDVNSHESWTQRIDHQLGWDVIGPLMSEGVMKDFDTTTASFSGLMRSHLEVMYCWRQFSRMQKTRKGYDPNSLKKRNDGIDFHLYRFLKLPAFVVTEDAAFHGGLADMKSFQATWFFKPKDLADSWASGKAPAPVWPLAKDLLKR